jgi:peptidoglycan hydrolase-like protein with peptidoglycan-binding domain
LVPADNATNVNGAANLVITFSEAVTTGTGTIAIYRRSDDVLIESIPVVSSQVIGSGTASITINPTATLADNTEYYVLIGANAFESASNVFYVGIANTTSWNFTTGDYTGPVFSAVSVAPERESAIITWTTDELASSQVIYGVDGLTTETTTEINLAPRVTSHSVTISPLTVCTEYTYQLVGTDGSVNTTTATSSVFTFTTDGCSTRGSATRRPVRASEPEVTAGTVAANGMSALRTLWNNRQTTEAVNLIVSDESYMTSEPGLVVTILQAYLGELQARSGVAVEVPVISGVRDLYLTMSGEDVRQLQELLIRVNTGPAARELARVTATGYFSTYTKNALGEYQLANGIVPYVGYFGVITRTQMKAAGMSGLWW